MKIKTNTRSGLGMIALIILIFVIVLISAYVVGCIVKIARKIPNDPDHASNSTQCLSEGEPKLELVNTQTGEITTVMQVMGDSVRNGTTNSIMVQRWFPDGRPEVYLYTTNLSWFQEVGVEDSEPPADMGFYHVYIVAP